MRGTLYRPLSRPTLTLSSPSLRASWNELLTVITTSPSAALTERRIMNAGNGLPLGGSTRTSASSVFSSANSSVPFRSKCPGEMMLMTFDFGGTTVVDVSTYPSGEMIEPVP